CNLRSFARLPPSVGVANGPRKNNNARTSKMRGSAIPQRNEVPAAPSAIAGLEQTFAHPGSEPASMRKFVEYAFLKDSRYARQAKSKPRFPPRRVGRTSLTRVDALWRDPDADWPRRCRCSADDQRKGWLYSAASSGARFSAC